jgi:hypothetical protein
MSYNTIRLSRSEKWSSKKAHSTKKKMYWGDFVLQVSLASRTRGSHCNGCMTILSPSAETLLVWPYLDGGATANIILLLFLYFDYCWVIIGLIKLVNTWMRNAALWILFIFIKHACIHTFIPSCMHTCNHTFTYLSLSFIYIDIDILLILTRNQQDGHYACI